MVDSRDPALLQEKLREALSDEAFTRSLLEMDEPADVQKALAEKGIELSEEAILKARDVLLRTLENDGELTEDDLENVAGGLFVLDDLFIIPLVVTGGAGVVIVGGLTVAGVLGALGKLGRRW